VNPGARPCWLAGGWVVDGTGDPPFVADVVLRDGQIESIGCESDLAREGSDSPLTLDCRGMVIAPGFIDVHSHSDLQVVEGRNEKLVQGVTAEVVGNCGFSPFPKPADPRVLRSFANGILGGSGDWGWASAGEYLRSAAQSPTANVAALVGHGSLRLTIAGQACRPLCPSELDQMVGALKDELAQGAAGLSSGLMYAPGSAADLDELCQLCAVVAEHRAIYATHMRDYGSRLLPAVQEQIEIAERTGCRLQISHLQAVGEENWPLQQRAIAVIEAAVARGIDIAFDAYPWLAGSTVLTQLLPQSALDGGLLAFRERISDPQERERIVLSIQAEHGRRWQDLVISASKHSESDIIGRSIQEIAMQRCLSPANTVLEILDQQDGDANILEYNQSIENLRALITHPLCIVVTDGLYSRGQRHPRLYGTFPKLLGEIVRDRKWLSLPEAVRKVTSFPAERFHLHRQGSVKPGNIANLVIFDPDKIQNHGSYDHPTKSPSGIRYVIRNGSVLVGDSSSSGANASIS